MAALDYVERFVAYVYERANPQGWHMEWWLHVGGCRRLLKVVRHTLTHQIHFVGSPLDAPASAASPSNEVQDVKP
jgi:heterotetrameric sarcosine oxidase delta subunit